MPIPATASFPPPQSPDEFDNIVADALRLMFKRPSLIRFGRSGQRQGGIDGLDPTVSMGESIVWQATIQQEDVLAKIVDDLKMLDARFVEQPKLFVAAVGHAKRDAGLQLQLQEMSAARLAQKKCAILALTWSDIRDQICNDEHVARKHFAAFFAPATPASDHGARWASQIGRSITRWLDRCIDLDQTDLIPMGPVVRVCVVGDGAPQEGVPRLGTWDLNTGRFVPVHGDGSSDTVRLETDDGPIEIPLSTIASFIDLSPQ